eukprot:TRINITY_DN1524_c0_g1_i2.p2 TRINITY_DN1524_c0_g1~~TRINITY_DN1524_c0_g1_i2.p2  ORF type:complete len:140 (+),score=25.43 TRINITY_DN1524_c0_g1_i2:62-481(+)
MVNKNVGKVLTMLAGLANLGVGPYCLVKYSTDDVNVPKIFLSSYIIIFGIMIIITAVEKWRKTLTTASHGKDPLIGFLGSPVTRALFMVFVGTLGVSFGVSQIAPFVVGFVTMGVAVTVTCVECCSKDHDRGDNAEDVP